MIIFITGATSGFGLAMTEKFISHGHQVIAVGRRQERLDKMKKDLGVNLLPLCLDIKNKNLVVEKISELPTNWKNIDVLINNAGMALGTESAQKSSILDWEEMIQTNINGLLYCTHAVLPGMVERNKGQIINLGSVAGEFPYPGGNVYGATKAFVHQFSLNLRADLLGTKVRVTNIEPGMCQTEFSEVRFRGDKTKANNLYAGMTPLTAADIAETIEWITSRPSHLNVNVISLMPTDQAFSGFAVHRS